MSAMIIIYILVVAVFVTAVVVFLFLRRQKKAVMEEMNQLSLRLTEMETKVVLHSSLSPTKGEEDFGTEDSNNSPSCETSNLSAMTDEELFGYLSKTIKNEEMFRRPDLNRKAVMEYFSLSAIRIGNAFVRGGGTSLPEFVRNCRLDYACRLMVEQPEMPFTEVGSQSGYQRATTFYHDFKARFGMPPAEYREQELRLRTHEIVNPRLINYLIVLLFVIVWGNGRAQTVIGTVGMMNVPTADMRPAGTFDGGACIVQKELLYQKSYYTCLYYIDFTPFSWLEVTLRETLIKTRKSQTEPDKIGFYQQDRSSTIRVRPLKEGKYWPAVVIGVNDIYASKEGGSEYACSYVMVSKHFPIAAIGTFEVTVGYARPHKVGKREGITYDGVMGGLSFAPAFFQNMRIMAEYDTKGFNVGVSAFLLRHLNITCFTREFKGFNATVSYQYTIPY